MKPGEDEAWAERCYRWHLAATSTGANPPRAGCGSGAGRRCRAAPGSTLVCEAGQDERSRPVRFVVLAPRGPISHLLLCLHLPSPPARPLCLLLPSPQLYTARPPAGGLGFGLNLAPSTQNPTSAELRAATRPQPCAAGSAREGIRTQRLPFTSTFLGIFQPKASTRKTRGLLKRALGKVFSPLDKMR